MLSILLGPIINSEVGRRSVVDMSIATTYLSTRQWWADLSALGHEFLFWGSVFLLAVRIYGMGKDIVRGYRQYRAAKLAKLLALTKH